MSNGDAADKDAQQAQQLFAQGLALHQKGQLAQAHVLYEQVLKLHAKHSDALHLLGVIAYQTMRPQVAVGLIGKAIEIDPRNAFAYSNLGNALQLLDQFNAALLSYDKAIALKPDFAEAYNNRGNTLKKLRQLSAALQSYDKAIALKADYAEAYSNRGAVLRELRQNEASLQSCDKAIALKQDYAEAYNNRGNVLRELKQLGAALQSYDKAIALRPDYAEAHNNRGAVLQELHDLDAALVSHDKAIALKPDLAEAHHNRGAALRDLKRLGDAVESFERALVLKPDYDFLYGMVLHTKMRICDWSDLDTALIRLAEKIHRSEKVSNPFPVIASTDSPSLQRKAAEIWVREMFPLSRDLPRISKRSRHPKIRLGYFSPDFRNHPVSYLTVELFERHDRTKFDLTAFSFGFYQDDEMRRRVRATFDRFIDVRAQSDKDVAQLSRSLEIDIAIDLAGFTRDSRPGIFAVRAAPLQVGYLGYLGTMGAEYIDYLIADSTIIPQEDRGYYSEKIIYLPSYQVNDSKKRIGDRVFTRQESGLPERGFVFCCFNNSYKITPKTFDGWMRIISQVDRSVLFLYADNELTASNLKKEAARRGVNPDRLIFAKPLPMPEYLSRFRAADLFLDTLPYNAGTTGSDALWVGLPVVTCVGKTFAGRVAASLLNAIHLPELVTKTQEEYEALAAELATSPERLEEIKQKLRDNRLTTPLFDTSAFTKHIEAAFTAIYERYIADLQPDYICVEPRESEISAYGKQADSQFSRSWR